jgi:integrase
VLENNALMMGKKCVQEMEKMQKENEIRKVYPSKLPSAPSADGYYHIQIPDETRPNGRRHLKAKTKEDLMEKIVQHFLDEKPNPSSIYSVKSVFEEKEKERLATTKDPNKKMSAANTYKRNLRDFNRFVGETAFAAKDIRKLSRTDINNFVRFTISSNEFNKSAVKQFRSLLSSIFTYAQCMGYTDIDPSKCVNWRTYIENAVETADPSERCYDDSEVSAIYQSVREHECSHPENASFWAYEFTLLVGTRRGEVPPLCWDDINFEKRFISFNKSLIETQKGEPSFIKSKTKNGKKRTFPMDSYIVDFLKRLRANNEIYHPDSPFLFPNENLTPPCISITAVISIHYQICRELGITVDKAMMKGPHSLRRNAISGYMTTSTGNKEVAALLYGNSPRAITEHYERSVLPDACRDTVEQEHERRFGSIYTPVLDDCSPLELG